MMAVMENITKLVRANKFTLDTAPCQGVFDRLVVVVVASCFLCRGMYDLYLTCQNGFNHIV